MLYIATLAEIKAALEIADPQDDAQLTLHAEGLQGRFDIFLGRTLLLGSYVEYFDGGEALICLKAFPVVGDPDVRIDADQVWGADTLLAAADRDYTVKTNRGVIYYGSGSGNWPESRQSIRVAYSGGYAAGSVPEHFRRAFFMQFGFEWRNRRTLGANSISAQGQSVNLAPAKLLPDVTEILNLEKRI